MNRIIAALRSLVRSMRSSQLDRDMDDEMRFHIDMEAQRLAAARDLDAVEARRQAAIAFGGVEKYRGEGRDALGLSWLRGLSTDVKLGSRMLRKHPGLTLIGTLALSLAIGAGAAYLEFVNDLYRPRLPFAHGERLVGIQNLDVQTGLVDEHAMWDFAAWRGTLRTVPELGAYSVLDRNLITDDGRSELVKAVEISASAFTMLNVPPFLGRPLVDSDERAGAAPVAVIGYDLWHTRFQGDRSAIGRAIKLGAAAHTIVGVMPKGFGFPIYHDLWVPLIVNDAAVSPRTGKEIKIFGMLAPGTGFDAARAELSARATRAATAHPESHQYLRPQVQPYVASLWLAQPDGAAGRIVLYSANLFFLGLLGVCGANIATLVFARTATRANEINVRTALGASRARIAGQLFLEALVLCGMSAALGLVVAYYGLIWVKRSVFVAQGIRPMFWWNDQLSIDTILYAMVLAIVGAVIIGVLPAWKATGTRLHDTLKQATTVTSGLKLGGVWTGVIVAQVGLTVIFLCIVGALTWSVAAGHGGITQLSFPGEQYMSMRLGIDGDSTADDAVRLRFRERFDELKRRLLAEPGVGAVTFASHAPGTSGQALRIELDGNSRVTEIRSTAIDVDLPKAFALRIVSGRGFTTGDSAAHRNVAIVDRTFMQTVTAGHDPVGMQVREAAEDGKPAGPWLTIVGVMEDTTDRQDKSAEDAFLYRPIDADAAMPLTVVVRASGAAGAIGDRLRAIAADVDPTLRVDRVQTLAQIAAADRIAVEFFVRIGAGIAAVALMLSTAGIYALLSFTVARRTPEIAIRLALGAGARRVVSSIFARAILQVALGVLAGCVPGAALVSAIEPGILSGSQASVAIGTSAAVACFMVIVTVLACYGPARRALRIQPTDALKAD